MKNPEISIIIITKNDFGVEETLESLRHIRYPAETEIIVVDGSNPADTLSQIQKKYPEARWVTFDSSKSSKATFPEQRNIGVANSIGRFLVWLDCGCEPQSNWLEILFASSKNANALVTSRVLGKGRNSIFEIDSKHLQNHLVERFESGTIGLGFSREIFDKVGGFDERFSYAEDVDFTWTARKLGYKIFLNSEAIIFHDWENWQKEIKRAFKYGASRAKLYKKHTRLWRQLFGYDANVLIYSCFILGLPIAYFFPPYLLILIVPFVKNIKRKPLIITMKNLIYAAGVLWGTLTGGYSV